MAGRRILLALLAGGLLAAVLAPGAAAEQSTSKAKRLAAGFVDADGYHTCAILTKGRLRCWGWGSAGRLGQGNTENIGDNELPSSAPFVSLGAGRKARAVALGEKHACAILDNARVRCWGDGSGGRLGYGNPDTIGDNELPSSVGPLDLGGKARAIAAGEFHTCAILASGKVRCWGSGAGGRLGYGNENDIGDNEAPGSVAPVFLGTGRTAVAISAGGGHTCAILDNGRVRCWGFGHLGALGYGNENDIGDNETPGSVAPVFLGTGRTAVAITAAEYHTCALLDNGRVRCWGLNDVGQLGYGNMEDIGDNELPGSVGPVSLGRKAIAVSGGYEYACALLDNGRIRCWGDNPAGQLGYANDEDIGDNELPSSAGPVQLGGLAVSVSAGWEHACALMATGRIRCWARNGEGQLGLGNTTPIGDNEHPNTVPPASAGGLVPRKIKPGVTLNPQPVHDASAPYRTRAAGRLRHFIADPATCRGKVTVRATRGSLAVVRRVRVRLSAGACAYAARVRVPTTGMWRLTARFGGNSSLRPSASARGSFHAGHF